MMPRFDEVWIGDKQLAKTAVLAAQTEYLAGYGEPVEIGAWQGRSTIHIAKAIAPSKLHIVDHWLGSDDMDSQIRARDNFSIFLSNMREATDGNWTVHRMDWRDWIKEWTRPLRFLHLDAGHTADEVADTLEALRPLALPGAVYAGDDWNWDSVRDGVLRIFKLGQVHTFLNKLWWVNL